MCGPRTVITSLRDGQCVRLVNSIHPLCYTSDVIKYIITLCGNTASITAFSNTSWEKGWWIVDVLELDENMTNTVRERIIQAKSQLHFWRLFDLIMGENWWRRSPETRKVPLLSFVHRL
jgi:hypothetical protein